jgi:hypothetical protein
MKKLNLGGVDRIDECADMEFLEWLEIPDTSITRVQPLTNLKHLKWMYVQRIHIVDVSIGLLSHSVTMNHSVTIHGCVKGKYQEINGCHLIFSYRYATPNSRIVLRIRMKGSSILQSLHFHDPNASNSSSPTHSPCENTKHI